MLSWNGKYMAASIHELAMLLLSPTQVTVTLEKSGVRS